MAGSSRYVCGRVLDADDQSVGGGLGGTGSHGAVDGPGQARWWGRATRVAGGIAVALVLGATSACGGPATAAPVGPAPESSPASSEAGASEAVRTELAAAGIKELDTVDGLLVDQLGGSVCQAWGAGVRQDAVVGLIGEAYSTLTEVEAIRVSAAISKAYCPRS